MQAPETPAQAATTGGIQVSSDVLKACGLSDTDAYFPFDSTRLERQDIVPLNAISVCFTTGGLKGHSVKLVGHADPRGATEYNMTLGQSRADGVETYLEKKGLAKAKVETTSRGAMDATGTDEVGWAHDRRVDLMLAN
jgi:peptidoglycan-associated lipoprotein